MLRSAPSVHRNKEPIKNIIDKYIDLDKTLNLFEIGSGTGEHAVYFSRFYKNITWQTSDSIDNHDDISSHIKHSNLKNVLPPIEYQAGSTVLKQVQYDLIFTANTLHIMSFDNVCSLLKDIANISKDGTVLFIYGPFKYNGMFTSESNEKFEGWLKDRSQLSGIRDFEKIEGLLKENSFDLLKDHKMPANNQLLVFKKSK